MSLTHQLSPLNKTPGMCGHVGKAMDSPPRTKKMVVADTVISILLCLHFRLGLDL